MAIKFTEDQKTVIELRNRNILVSAAAGSGKTAVLVERIIQMVCDRENPVDIDRLLVVTFTKAAAAEMRERIAAALAQRLEENPEDEHAQKQAALLHNAHICTIDSFCSFLVKNHFNEIGLDPAYRMIDEGEKNLMEQEAMAELLEDAFASGKEEIRHCVEYFCHGNSEKALEEFILNMAKYASSYPWPRDWLIERKADCRKMELCEFETQKSGEYLKKHLSLIVDGCIEKYNQILSLCKDADGPYMYEEQMLRELEMLTRLKETSDLQSFSDALGEVIFKTLASCRDKTVSEAKKDLAQNYRNKVKDTVTKHLAGFFDNNLEVEMNRMEACRRPVSTLIDLTLDFMDRMDQKKREKKSLDFADVAHYALDILVRKDENGNEYSTPIAEEYRDYFVEVMIDEYQDSNMIQEYLLKAVSGEETGKYNRFIVGDVKQSIYKFRLSRPELFIEKYNEYKYEGEKRRIDLAKNFRSRPQVVDAVNDVFSRLMSVENGGVEYDDKAALYVGAEYPEVEDADAELILIDKPGKDSEYKVRQTEAMVIGNRIKELCRTFQVTDKATRTLRPLRYSDIVILLRAGSGWADEFRDVLETMGIPTHVPAKTGYFSATEIQTILQFLRVLDNPCQDIPLFGVMRSVFGGFSDEEIAKIRSGKKKQQLYHAILNYGTEADQAEDSLAEKTRSFVEQLKIYREYAVYMPIRDLITKIINDFEYLNYVTALPGGSKRRGNVEMLLTKASDFEKTSYFGLFHFVRYMEQLEKYNVDFGEADRMDENADVVRIVTIHKSKGLEFPVVFLAGMSKTFNTKDTSGALIVDSDLGVAAEYVDLERRIHSKTLQKKIISTKMREENVAEEMRLLYVAMTRAKEKLIMTGVVKDAQKRVDEQLESKQERITYSEFVKANTYLDFVLPIVNQSSFQVDVACVDDLALDALEEQINMAQKRHLLTERKADTELCEKLKRRLTAVYPGECLKDLYTKTTVSELKIAAMSDKDEEAYHAFEHKEEDIYIPKFRREKEEVTGTVRGNAYHRVMELLDLSLSDEASICAFLEQEVREKRLTEEYKNAVWARKILNFLQSPLGQRMKKAQEEGKLYKEQPFVLGIPAKRLKETYPEQETVLIQGIIDVFWEEDGELVLLDYKTDAVPTIEDLWNRYSTQIDYYKEALEHIMGKPVKESFLYSFHLETY